MVKQAKEAAIGHLAKAVSHALKNRFLSIAGQIEIAKELGMEFKTLLEILYALFAISLLFAYAKADDELVPFIANCAGGIAANIVGNKDSVTMDKLESFVREVLK